MLITHTYTHTYTYASRHIITDKHTHAECNIYARPYYHAHQAQPRGDGWQPQRPSVLSSSCQCGVQEASHTPNMMSCHVMWFEVEGCRVIDWWMNLWKRRNGFLNQSHIWLSWLSIFSMITGYYTQYICTSSSLDGHDTLLSDSDSAHGNNANAFRAILVNHSLHIIINIIQSSEINLVHDNHKRLHTWWWKQEQQEGTEWGFKQ